MTEHVHKLVITDERNVICIDLECDFRLTWRQAVARLNEYEKLKAATDVLSAEMAEEIATRFGNMEMHGTEHLIDAALAYVDILEGKDD